MEARNHRKRPLVCLVVTNSKINFKLKFLILHNIKILILEIEK